MDSKFFSQSVAICALWGNIKVLQKDQFHWCSTKQLSPFPVPFTFHSIYQRLYKGNSSVTHVTKYSDDTATGDLRKLRFCLYFQEIKTFCKWCQPTIPGLDLIISNTD